MQMRRIAEWRDVDAAMFGREIRIKYEPAVLRGVARDWPAVRKALESADVFARYVAGLANGTPVDVLRMPPSAGGRIFYADGLNGFNYTHERLALSTVLERLAKYARQQRPPGLAAQSALISDCMPGFAEENVLPILDPSVAPRIWLGNAVITPAHFDESNNVACVVAGRRRFTLFPPEQVGNLYIGPIGYAPTGTPISLVSFRDPDFARFPRFREALAAGWTAELEPGDALYIPALWWHHVESLDTHNALVNYWWRGGSAESKASALDSLLLAILNLRDLPPEQREAWRSIFDHFVFNATEETARHIPAARRGVLGPVSPELSRQVREFLVNQLKGP
jgi:hypothetical protein